jgi:CheY-like chemotaxis protein
MATVLLVEDEPDIVELLEIHLHKGGFQVRSFTNGKSFLDYLKKNHRITGSGAPEDGGVAGSAPIWGRYSMFEYPNWAAKFFADALMIRLYERAIPATDRGRRA